MSLPKRLEVLAIGDELLDGRVADTNTLRLAQALRDVGVSIAQRTTVTDDVSAIVREAEAAVDRGADLCVVSGGLGPTSDDVTAEALAAMASVALVRDVEAVARITSRLQARGRVVGDNQLRQADRPAGSLRLDNALGTAPGFELVHRGCRFVSVPGVPQEFDAMVQAAVIAPLRKHAVKALRQTFYCFGLAEGEADQRLHRALAAWPGVRVGYRVKLPEIHVTLMAPPGSEASFDAATEAARDALGEAVFAEDEISLPAVVLDALRCRGATLALAESCTGGLACDLLTDVPGSSDVVLLGVLAYANSAKVTVLGVDQALLDAHGAVSEPVVRAMAEGVRRRAGSTFGVATTGVAGPGGGSSETPVGTVFMAWSGPQGCETRRITLRLDRRGNKRVGAYAVLSGILRVLQSSSAEGAV